MASPAIETVDVNDIADQSEDNNDSAGKNGKAILKAAQDQFHTALDKLLYLDRALLKNGGRPLTGVDGVTVTSEKLKELHVKALAQIRLVFATQRGGGKGSKKGGKGNVGFKKADIFSERPLKWLNDPRTTFNPAGFQPFITQVNADGTLTKVPVAPNTPLQHLITALKNDKVEIPQADGSIKTYTLRGVSSSGIMAALFSLYLDLHDLKGVPDPSKIENGKPKIDRRFYHLDANLEEHFGEFFRGPIAVAMEAQNVKNKRKGKPFVVAGPTAIPNGMTMKLFSLLKDKDRSSADESLLKHPHILAMVNADQDLISTAVTFNKQQREATA